GPAGSTAPGRRQGPKEPRSASPSWGPPRHRQGKNSDAGDAVASHSAPATCKSCSVGRGLLHPLDSFFERGPVGRGLGIAFVVVWSLAAALASGTEAGRIAGRVLDPTGAPLAGASVALAGAHERRAATSADGAFALDGLPDGEYELEASLAGFAPSSFRVRIEGGEAAPVVFKLRVVVHDSDVVTAAKTVQRELD